MDPKEPGEQSEQMEEVRSGDRGFLSDDEPDPEPAENADTVDPALEEG